MLSLYQFLLGSNKSSFPVGAVLQPWLLLHKEGVRVMHIGQYLIDCWF